jgi:hypothetical protein
VMKQQQQQKKLRFSTGLWGCGCVSSH